MLSPPLGAFTTYSSVVNTETNLSTTVGGNPATTVGAVAAQGTGYTLVFRYYRISNNSL